VDVLRGGRTFPEDDQRTLKDLIMAGAATLVGKVRPCSR
jgi:hypothetical protein